MRSGLLFLCAALIWGSALLTRSPQRQQELRVLITARNMVESGNWLHFEFQNQPRYRKPPLAYWVAGTGFWLTGQHTSAWAGRLFFALAALGGLWLFRSLAGDPAAILLLFTYGSLVYGPLAETDFLQLTGLILAFWGWNRANGWASGAGMAMAVLAKGPGGVVIPLLCFLLLINAHPRSIRFWIQAVLLPLLAGGGWILYLQLDPVASQALAADLSATFVDTAHRNPFPYYIWTLPLVMAPSCLAVFWAKRTRKSPESKVALVWFVVTFVLLTLTVSKQRHYALMLIPPACWWLGRRLSNISLHKSLVIAATTAAVGLNIASSFWSEDARHDRFLHQARSLTRSSKTLHVVGINSARFDFHFGRHVANTDSLSHAYARAEPGDTVYVVKKRVDTSLQESHLPAPVLSDDDGTWIRQVYQKF